MSKKFLVAVVLAAVICTGAFAQLMIGVTGALYMDTTNGMSFSGVVSNFKANAWYGGFLELSGKNLGLGVQFNSSAPYQDPVLYFNWQNYDASLYLSYHLFGSRAFLDPMLDLGFGAMFQMNDQSQNIVDGTYYWYPAVGVGVNLGILGVFAKFAANIPIRQQLTQDGSPVPYYLANGVGPDGVLYDSNGYFPNFRLTVGAKLIL